MLAGLRAGKNFGHRLVVHDRNPGKLSTLKKRYAVAVEADLKRAVEQADILISSPFGQVRFRELLFSIGEK